MNIFKAWGSHFRNIVARRMTQTSLYRRYKTEAKEENRKNILIMTLVSVVVSGSILLSRLWIPRYRSPNTWIVYGTLFGFDFLCLFLSEPLMRLKGTASQWFSYFFVAANLALSILGGTIYLPPSTVTFAFFVLLIILPLYIIDTPWRKLVFMAASMLVFAYLDYYRAGLPGDQTYYGTFVSDMAHLLESAASSLIGQYVFGHLTLSNVVSREEAETSSRKHTVSGLLNRKALVEDTKNYVGNPLCVRMFDIDHFKAFNDTYGHRFGDEVILAMGNGLKKTFGEKHAYSFGGDEFIIVTPEIVTKDEAEEALKKFYGDGITCVYKGKNVRLEFSCGYVIGRPKDADELNDSMLLQADKNLYWSKDRGRNCYTGGYYEPGAKCEAALDPVYHPSDKALIDPLTSLPTPIYFRSKAAQINAATFDKEKKPMILFCSFLNFKEYCAAHGTCEGRTLVKNFAGALKMSLPDALICHSSASHFYVYGTEKELLPVIIPIVDEIHLLSGEELSLKAGYVYLDSPDADVNEACERARLGAKGESVFVKEIDRLRRAGKKE